MALKFRRRLPGESLQVLYQEVARLIASVYPGSSNLTTDTVCTVAFLDALGDKSMALRVREREPSNSEQALKIAVRFKTYGKADDSHEPVTTNATCNSVKHVALVIWSMSENQKTLKIASKNYMITATFQSKF